MAEKAFYGFRLSPNDPNEQRYIALLEEAKRRGKGAMQEEIIKALSLLLAEKQQQGSGGNSAAMQPAREVTPPALIEAIQRAYPAMPAQTAEILAQSKPMARLRSIYATLEALTPDAMTEIEAMLLWLLRDRLAEVVREAASARPPIRKSFENAGLILETEGDASHV